MKDKRFVRIKKFIRKSSFLLFFLFVFCLFLPKSIYAAADPIEISTKDQLITLLRSNNQKNKKIVIKNNITINSEEIPNIGSNVELTNCIVTGEGEDRPTITINKTGDKLIQPLFGKILGNPQDVTDKKEESPVLQNFNIVCNGKMQLRQIIFLMMK